MHKTIDVNGFREAFHDMGRGNQFSYEALQVLFDYYDECDDIELDVIAICCEWGEWESLEELKENYSSYLCGTGHQIDDGDSDKLDAMTDNDIISQFQEVTQILEVTDKSYISGITSTSYLVLNF